MALKRVVIAFIGAFCFTAMLGASSDAHSAINSFMLPGELCKTITPAGYQPVYGGGIYNGSSADALVAVCPVVLDTDGISVNHAYVHGWDNESDGRVSAKWCFQSDGDTSAGCGALAVGSTTGVGNYALVVNTSLASKFDYNYISVEIPGKPSAGKSSVRGIYLGVNY